jgi:cell envelope opacity-associated protein A
MSASTNDPRLASLKEKYSSVLRTIEQQGVRLSHVHVQDNKLFVQGVAPSDAAKNKVWDQIKLVNPQYDDITADITVDQTAQSTSAGSSASSAHSGQTYTVQTGDTLSKIAKQFYGDANKYTKIFEANRDKLSDPNKIQVGQALNIPA